MFVSGGSLEAVEERDIEVLDMDAKWFWRAAIKIGNYAFENCSSLSSLDIPDSIKEIGDGAFKGCENLKEITIPASVKKIGAALFMHCNKLAKVTIKNKENLSAYLNLALIGFDFDSFETNGDEVVFIKKIENDNIYEKDSLCEKQ